MRKPSRRRLVASVVALGVVAIVVWWWTRDPEASVVARAAFDYVGDLKAQAMTSASRRVFPDDLLVLKEAALNRAGTEDSFRTETLEFFQARDLDEVRRAPKERFFEFLLLRAYRQHRDLFDLLARGEVEGIRVRRDEDQARVSVSVRVQVPEGRRQLTMRLEMTRSDGVWWVRI